MVSFVILHYNDIAITNECINYLLQMKDIEENSIIVVDNSSPNGSGADLKKKYENNEIVDVILIAENVGFAKGNDVGYYYAKKKGNMDYIIVMNNDVMIKDADFICKLSQSKLNEKAEIVLPEIINKSGKNQNPYRVNPVTTNEINKMFFQKLLLFILYSIPVLCDFMMKRNKRKENQSIENKNEPGNYTEMLVPHGSCVIFTKRWIEKEELAFIPDTFMYHEEDILYEYLMNRNYKTIYYCDLLVLHMEDVSTNTVAQTDLKKARFYLKHSIRPIILLKKIRRMNNKHKQYKIDHLTIKKIVDTEIIW